MTQITMYPAQPDSPDFTLASDITDSETAITFTDLTDLLAAPNTLTIREDDNDTTPETVYYASGPVGNVLTVTRGYGGTTAKAFVAGAVACRAHTSFDHNTFRSNILDLASSISGLAVDTAVFHKATAGEINALTVKGSPASADVLMIEDSDATYAKKKVAISTLPFALLASPTFTGTPAAPTAPNGTQTTQIATTEFVQNAIAYLDPLLYKGVIDCSANPNYPAADAGYTYIISVSGKIGGASGKTALVGDMLICNHDGSPAGDEAAVGTYWNIITVNTGAVIGPASSTDGNMAVFDGATGKIVKDGGVPVAQPSVLGSPTLTTYQDFLNGTGSGGRIYGGQITDAGAGLINISALKGFIVIADYTEGSGAPATIKFFDLAAQAGWGGSGVGTTLTTDSVNYIYVDYNAGTPTVKCTTDRSSIRHTDQFTLGRVFKIDATTIEIMQSGINLYNRVRLSHEKWIDTFGGLSYANGMAVSTTGGSGGVSPYLGPRPAFTAGVLYAGSNKITVSAVDCNAGGTFTEFYYNPTAAAWVKVTGLTQLDNVNYNNTSSGTGLTALTVNRYGVHWLYISPEGSMYIVLGQGDYTLALAQAAAVPSTLPNFISEWCVLAAKIIVQKSSTTAYEIDSAWMTAFPVSQPTDHNSLAGLQGGTTDQYYHLTSAQHTNLTNSWAAFSPSPVWGTANPTISSTVARYIRTGNIVAFNISFVISDGNAASSLTMSLPVAAPQTANYQYPLISFKKISSGGSDIMSDPFGYIDYTEATPTIKFNQFGTLPSGYTAVLNISGTYEVA